MKNAHASEAPFLSRGTQSFPAADAPGRPDARHGRRNLVLGLVAISVAAVTVGGVQFARVSSQAHVVAQASELVEGAAAIEAYQQDGSIYAEQVPLAAATANLPAYTLGGSVYAEQVPSAAANLPAYSLGGSVYAEQVPSVG
jgi:hypothetical protein